MSHINRHFGSLLIGQNIQIVDQMSCFLEFRTFMFSRHIGFS